MESNLTKKNVEQILSELKNSSINEGFNHLKTKLPKTYLQFKKAQIGNVYAITKGYDNYYYLIKANGSFEKVENLDNNTPVETSTWDVATLGTPVEIVKSPEGIAVATTVGTDTTQGRWYYLENITSAPQLVYETASDQNSRFVKTLGISSYTNGLNGMILAGVYGSGANTRDLILSLDGGQTFKVIKQTKNVDTVNSHWHATAFDIYNGLIWASEGDQAKNRATHLSDDFGKTWHTFGEGTEQPTAIIPFADRIVLGNDEDFVGLKYLEKPQYFTNYAEWTGNVKPLKRIRPSVRGYEHYVETPIYNGKEAYVGFFQYYPIEPNVIMASGDGGLTWHHVFISQRNTGNTLKVSVLWGMDDEYLYGLKDSSSDGYEIVYAKKVVWE